MVARVIRSLKKTVRRNPLAWRYLLNREATALYKRRGLPLTGEAARVVKDLDRDGVAITSLDRLFPAADALPRELRTRVDELEAEQADVLAELRRDANDPELGSKTFLCELLGRKPVLDAESVFARFALSDAVLGIANGYFRMLTQLRYYNVWHTFATNGQARESQLWHRDREDHLILKVFCYCSDVDLGAGPFTYAPRTHPKGAVRNEPDGYLENGVRRTTDEQMAALVPEDKWARCTGQAGTIVFADTRGYHKGGEARTSDRVMFTALFTSAASQSADLLVRPERLEMPAEPDRRFALKRVAGA